MVGAELVRWARGTLDGTAVAWHRALLATCEAEWSRVQGELDPEGWLAAVAAWEQTGHPSQLAMARWRAAEALLARRGDRDLAAELLRRGHATAVELGAAPLRAELERLARLGRVELTAGAAADGQAPDRPADATAPASVHVSNILAKLGVASRVEAAAVAHRLGLLDQRPGP
jgi:hypothetical protein